MMETVTTSEDGTETFGITAAGSRYQLVDETVSRRAPDRVGEYLVPLNDHPPEFLASWYVRRDRWTFFFKAAWKLMAFAARAELHAMRAIHLHRCKNKWHGGERPQWRTVLKRHRS